MADTRIEFGRNVFEHLDPDEAIRLGFRPPVSRPRRWTWLLSGGGAKGSFQVGALLFLSDHLTHFRPHAICGTSIGAINAILPSEGSEDSFRRLRDVWLALENESDMYLVTPEAERLESSLVAGLLDLSLAELGTLVLSDPPSGVETLDPRQAPLSAKRKARRLRTRIWAWGWLPIGGWGVGRRLENKLADFEELLGRTTSLYNMDPIRRRLDENVDFDRLQAAPGIALRLVSVALETGRPCFVDKEGRFAEVLGPGITRNFGVRGDARQQIINGALASAAIPFAFPPVVFDLSGIDVTPSLRTCVDGGVRDYLPTREAIDLVIKADPFFSPGVIAILNSSPYEFPLAPVTGLSLPLPFLAPETMRERLTRTFRDADILELAVQSFAISQNEVSRSDLLEVFMHDSEIPHHLIFPDYQITGTAQVDPGLVRINMAYGWMTAFETLNRASLGDGVWENLRRNTNEIAIIRLATWAEEHRFADILDLESALDWLASVEGELAGAIDRVFTRGESIQDQFARAHGFDSVAALLEYIEYLPVGIPNSVARLREMKRMLVERVRQRIDTFGRESLPSPETMGEHFSNWWLHWERHQTDSDPIEFGMATPWEAAFGTRVLGREIPPVPAESPPEL